MVQKTIKSVFVKSCLLIVTSLMVFSFSTRFGGEVFEIFLNNKLVVQQIVAKHEAVKTLQLDQTVSDGSIMVKYTHCGRPGTDRSIILKDENNNIVRKWHFVDDAEYKTMSCKVQEILSLQKTNGTKFSMYYVSKELPDGRLLASIVIGDVKKQA